MKTTFVILFALCGVSSISLADDLLDKALDEVPSKDAAANTASMREVPANAKADALAAENISALRKEIAALREEIGQGPHEILMEKMASAHTSIIRLICIFEAAVAIRPIVLQWN